MKLAVLAAAMLSVPLHANATELVDGSFERRGAWTPIVDYCYDGFSAAGRVMCYTNEWKGSGVIRSGAGSWGGTTTPSGTYFSFVQGASSLSQSFLATGNGLGVLTWIDANRANFGGLQSYAVKLDDGTLAADLGTFTSTPDGFVSRTSSSFSLVQGVRYTLTFTGLSDDDRTAFIDNVSLNVTSVPEPVSWLMMVIGFALIGLAARRHGPNGSLNPA